MCIKLKGQYMSIGNPDFHWIDGQRPPEWCFEKDRVFEVLEISALYDDMWRVVIGNHRKGNGPIIKGITGAFECRITY